MPLPNQAQTPNGYILQLNTNGIQNSFQQLQDFLQKHSILIAIIQETRLTATNTLQQFKDFTTIRKDRASGIGGGLITLIHHSLTYREADLAHLFPNDPHLEHQSVVVEVDGAELRVVNIYIPPTSSCQPDYTPDLTGLFSLTDDTLVGGDFNAHDPAWYSTTSDTRAARRGEEIADPQH